MTMTIKLDLNTHAEAVKQRKAKERRQAERDARKLPSRVPYRQRASPDPSSARSPAFESSPSETLRWVPGDFDTDSQINDTVGKKELTGDGMGGIYPRADDK